MSHAPRCSRHRLFTAGTRPALVLAAITGFAGPACAATFQVTTTADSGPGSLRQAILDANLTTAMDDVQFAIPGSGPFVIAPLSALPDITQPLRLDGYTQSGAVPNSVPAGSGGLSGGLMIELSGINLPNATGLDFNSTTTTAENLVRGLAINRFAVAISRFAGAPIRVEGCYIGTDASGTSVPAPIDVGISIRFAGDERIGGDTPERRNLIAGASRTISSAGIDISRVSAAAAPVIQGNLIGTDRTGTQALPNHDGIAFGHRLTPVTGGVLLIGGASTDVRNLISGNQRYAINIACSGAGGLPCAEAHIAGNFIGTDIGGELPLANGQGGNSAGIAYANQVPGPSHVLIGGYTPAYANRIAHNVGFGIRHAAPNGTLEVFRNVLRANAARSIELTGPRANDTGDPDNGPNNLQNHAVISAAAHVGNQLSVTYVVDTAIGNAAYPLTVHFYRSSGDWALEYLGEDTYNAADATLPRQAQIALPAGTPVLTRISALVTDSVGSTSELADEFTLVTDLFRDGFEDVAP
jgi:hypothetical protein